MKSLDIESRLTELGNRWPVPSVAGAVQSRLNGIQQPAKRTPSRRILQWTGMGAVAAAAVALIAIGMSMFAAPSSLYAQVKESIRTSLSAHLQIVSIDPSGSRTIGTLWYSRELGVRGEAGNEVFIDDGKQQWNWNTADNGPAIVSRRASRDGIAMVAESLQLPNPSEALVRASEYDREILDQKCKAFKVAIQSQQPAMRVLAWQNEAGKVLLVRTEQSDGARGDWRTTRELSITYNVDVPREKFTPQFPASATIVNEDRVWLDRFPIEKSLATAESGGLLFAVHELSRCENGSFYVVSSVRGSAEHLKQHPPKSRNLNLRTTVLEVAEQLCSPTSQQDFHLAPIASSEIDGVHFLWWLATDRNYFTVEAGKRIPQGVGTKMESELGRVELPLMAQYRGELRGTAIVSTKATVTLSKDANVLSLQDVTTQVLHDASLSRDGLLVHTFGNATGGCVPSSSTTVDQMVQSLQAALEWLATHDELGEVRVGGGGMPPAK